MIYHQLTRLILILLLSSVTFQNAHTSPPIEGQVYEVEKILALEIESSINPATLSYVQEAFKNQETDLILIKINTPGGLVTTTKEILSQFGSSKRPVVVWITPEGASATSAGAIIASGSHLLYMSPGTNIGAATPIQMGKDIAKESDMRKKAINDLVALVQSLSEARGRNPELFGKMIQEAASFKAEEANKEKLINGIINTESELIEEMNGNQIKLLGKTVTLNTTKATITRYDMDSGQKLLNIFADPSTAYMLFLIGAALIYLEFQAAGGFIAGAIGAVCLLLAGIGFQVLPLNFGALGLMVIAFILFVMEAFITSYGILSLAGLGSLIAGSLFLFRTDDAYLSLSTSFILSAVGAIASFLGICLYLILKDQKFVGKEKFNEQISHQGKVIKIIDGGAGPLYQVKVGGEFWRGTCEELLKEGDTVTIKEKIENTLNYKLIKVQS